VETPKPRAMAVALDWVETHCVIPDGFRKGAPFELYDYQLDYLAAFYLVRGDAEWVPENPILAPAFVYRRGLLVGPQKLGKGPHTAAHVCLEGAGPALFAGWAGKDDGYACADHGCPCGWEYPYEPGEPMGMRWPTPLIQITAFSQEQTDNIYDALRPMIEAGPLADIIPKTGEEFIRLPGGGRVDTVTSSAQSRLGQRLTFAPQDEVGIWTPYNKMTRVATTQYRGLAGMGGRASLTTNSWDSTENSVAQQEFDSPDLDVYRQFTRPPRSLSYRNKAERRKIHRIVYPPDTLRENGGHIDLDAIEAEAVSLLAKNPSEAERFFGNIVTQGAGHAVDSERWRELARPAHTVEPGTRIGVGFDGSISEDATALIACTADGHLFVPHALVHVNGVATFKPTIWLRPEHAPPGWRIPRSEVREAKDWIFATYDVGRQFCDPPKWATEIDEWSAEHNPEAAEDAIVIAFDTNQPKRMSGACDRFSVALAESTITHANDATLNDHVLAMVKKKAFVRNEDPNDGRTRYVFTKGTDGRKIDAGIGAVLAHEAAMTMPATSRQPDAEPFMVVT
jgi:hypothetical protein